MHSGPMDGRRRSVWTRAAKLLALASLLLPSAALAQEQTLEFFDPGKIGFEGMLTGLLVFSLAALAIRHRQSRELTERLNELETHVDERDDRIWQLEERLAHATQLIDAQGDFVVREDQHGRVTHASASICALLGKPLEQIIGRSILLDVRSESAPAFLADGSKSYDQEIATREGVRSIAWKEVAVRDGEGRVLEVQRVGRDVTSRVAAERALGEAREKAEAASRAKSRFLAVVSHEVRTPLNGILGMADLLFETSLSPEQQTYGNAVKTSGKALLGLIEEILDFSKIEAGRLDLETVPFDLSGVVSDVVELLAPRAQAKGIEIAADLDDDLPQRVVGDAARLRQVLLNLASNAVKFTDEGGVAVRVEHADIGRVRFTVRDTGPGVGADAQERIFREFEQGDNTLARHHGGTGLGLAIAGRIVERMGGEITLQSALEQGSVFSFTVDLPAATEVSLPDAGPNLRGLDVLVASPSPIVGPQLVRRLIAWGANAALVTEAAVAEAVLPERNWTHFLVDRAFGAGVTAALARKAEPHATVRHVLLSPAERGELADLRAAGFDSYLVKPVRLPSLAARLVALEEAPPLVPADVPSAADTTSPRRALSVLIAEDNDINALLAQALLAKLGHRPIVVGDGISAVSAVDAALAAGAPYDLILMDLHLPGMDGLEATRRIRALGDAGRIPIIALTANAFAEDREACREAGMDGFVVKPFDRDRLEEAIATARAQRLEKIGHAA
ncbi:MAG TPA: ATP-binding protein [Xanthobacteraceae bacterium]|nr:ATP-binding protein [Xanthobacteraceae bacterium]